jgi:hypothetical protein
VREDLSINRAGECYVSILLEGMHGGTVTERQDVYFLEVEIEIDHTLVIKKDQKGTGSS